MGGRGSSSGKGQSKKMGSLIFNPMQSDEISQKMSSAYDFKMSNSTITLKNSEGKTSGMIRGITRLSNIQANKEFEIASKLRKAGISISEIGGKENVFLYGNQQYIINNSKHESFLDGLSGKQRELFQGDIEKVKKKNEMLKKAESNGFIVINRR